MSDRVFSVHWRLQEFSLSRELIDFRSVAKKAWFGPLDLTGLPLVNTGGMFRRRPDLAVRGKPLTDLAEQELLTCARIAEERHRAMTWLAKGGVYSEVDTSA